MDRQIRIVEKPDWVSWDSVHNVIWNAHAVNREKGVVMRNPSLSGEEIKEKLGGKGKMLVALTAEDELVGTAAIMPKEVTVWFGKEVFAYCCFAAIIPEYSGQGIYKELCLRRESMALEMGLDKMLFDTHENNARMIGHALNAGYRFVNYRFIRDHFNVFMVKWLNGCPYTKSYCHFRYVLSRMKTKVRRWLSDLKPSLIVCAL